MITLAVLDMAGTTVADDGTVDAAFAAALTDGGLPAGVVGREEADRVVAETMGRSKIEVFTTIFGSGAARANTVFERAYRASVAEGRVGALPGAAETLGRLRDAGVRVCLTTGFSAGTRDLVLDALGWRDAVDLALCPADAGRGRPWPDMVWLAMLRLRAAAVTDVLVAGDTPSDVRSGVAAGAGTVVGVLSGAGSATDLESAGAHRVVPDVTSLPALVSAAR